MKTEKQNKTNQKESKSGIDRRKFMGLSALGAAAVASFNVGCTPQEKNTAGNAEKAIAKSHFKDGNGYGGYSGHKDFEYLSKPATVYDFGLTPDEEARAKAVHEKSVIFDNLMECTFYPSLIDNIKAGGGTSGNLSLGITSLYGWTPENSFEPSRWWSWEALTDDLDSLPELAKRFDDIMITLNHADILKAKKEGKVGFMPGTQNTMFLEGDIGRLKQARDKGLRIVQLTYNANNAVGSGSMELPKNRFGLSAFGERVVAEMNELNMMIDVGHSSPETMIAAAEASEKPIAISHAGMYSMVAQFRSTTDEAIKAVAKKGGVYGVITTPAALNGKDRCTINDYLDSMEHAINMVGIEAVGLGSDLIIPATFDHVLSAPEWDPEVVASIGEFEVWPWSDGHVGYENNSAYPNITRGLVKRGYSDEDISKILGGNWMRLIKETIG